VEINNAGGALDGHGGNSGILPGGAMPTVNNLAKGLWNSDRCLDGCDLFASVDVLFQRTVSCASSAAMEPATSTVGFINTGTVECRR
jgi:hypothetical protein